MWGGRLSRWRREGVCTSNNTESAARRGQKSLCSRGWCNMCRLGATKSNKGAMIKAKTHAAIGTIAYLSSIGVENLRRFNSYECIGALDPSGTLLAFDGVALSRLDRTRFSRNFASGGLNIWQGM